MNAVVALDRQGYSANRRCESVTRNDGFDKRFPLRALRETAGMTDPERTVFWMEKLAWSVHRGRGDTIGAAVQRVAAEIGAPVPQAKRCWDRWKEMKEVAGSVMIPFMLAYEEFVSANEAAASAYRAERLELKAQRNAAGVERAQAGVGTDAARV